MFDNNIKDAFECAVKHVENTIQCSKHLKFECDDQGQYTAIEPQSQFMMMLIQQAVDQPEIQQDILKQIFSHFSDKEIVREQDPHVKSIENSQYKDVSSRFDRMRVVTECRDNTLTIKEAALKR